MSSLGSAALLVFLTFHVLPGVLNSLSHLSCSPQSFERLFKAANLWNDHVFGQVKYYSWIRNIVIKEHCKHNIKINYGDFYFYKEILK